MTRFKTQILVWIVLFTVMFVIPNSMKLSFLTTVLLFRAAIVLCARARMAEIMEARHQEQLLLDQARGANNIWRLWNRLTNQSRALQVLDLTRWNFHDFYPELGVFK